MKKAQYTFSVYDFGSLHPHTVTVTIVEETEKQYKIRIPCCIGHHAPGDTMWVRRKSLRLLDDQGNPVPTEPSTPKTATPRHDYTKAFWNN